MKVKESNLGELIDWLDKCGWDKGIKLLESHNKKTEWLQADLYGNGDPQSIKKANKLSPVIIKQQITLIRLNEMRNKKLNNDRNPEPSVATDDAQSGEAGQQKAKVE